MPYCNVRSLHRAIPLVFVTSELTKYRMEEVRSATGKRPLGRPRRRWEDNIRMDLEEIGINVGNCVDSAQDRDYWNAVLNLRVP